MNHPRCPSCLLTLSFFANREGGGSVYSCPGCNSTFAHCGKKLTQIKEGPPPIEFVNRDVRLLMMRY